MKKNSIGQPFYKLNELEIEFLKQCINPLPSFKLVHKETINNINIKEIIRSLINKGLIYKSDNFYLITDRGKYVLTQ
jgi:predicted transcriptional regulator